MEALLLISLRLLRAANAHAADRNQLGQHLLKLHHKRAALLAALPDQATPTAADRTRWELVRYVNKITQKKIAAKI